MKLLRLVPLFAATLIASQAAVETYQIDSAHSSVVFNVRHFLAKVPGTFAKFTGTLTVDRENFENNQITAQVDIAGIDTRNDSRNKHLLSGDFFLAEKFPSASFQSKSWKKTGATTYTVAGDLTIRD